MHQQGLAVDFSGGFKRGPATDKRYVWLRANASKFGFYNNLAPAKADEYNHWSTTGR
jgi:LAS superfamily LD-carboxypeptidase LdcB